MILLSIGVRAVGPFRGEARLADLQPGLNILAAPNETGKSTLFQALHHGFFTSYKTNDRALKDLAPWSTNLGPAIDIEFQHGPLRYRLRKSFLSGHSCSLAEWTGTRYEPKFQDEDADQFVRDLLLGAKPEKGAAKPEHAGLARLLWVPQGRDALSAPTPGLAVSTRIRASLGTVVADPAEERLLDRLQDQYSDTYTAGRGQEAKGSALAKERERLGERTRKLGEIREHLQDLRTNVENLAKHEDRVRSLDSRVKGLKADIARLEGEAAAVSKLKADLRVAETELRSAQERAGTCTADLSTYRARAKRLSELAGENPGKQDASLAAAQLAEKLGGELRAAEAALTSANSELDKAREAYDRAAKQRKARADAEQLARLQSRRDRVTEAAHKVADLQLRAQAAPPVPEADRREAAQLQQELRELQAQIRATGISVVFDLDPPRRVTFEGSEGPGGGEAAPGAPVEAFTLDALEAEIAGVGSIRVKSGAGSAKDLKQQAVVKESLLQGLLGRHGVASVEQLEQRVADRHALDAEAKAAGDVLATLLEGHASAAALQQAVVDLETGLATRLATLGLTAGALATLEIPDEAQLEAAGKVARARRDEQVSGVEGLKARLKEAEDRAKAIAADLAASLGEQQSAQDIVRQVLSRYAGGVADLEAQASQAQSRSQELQQQVADLASRLPAPDADPEVLLALCKHQAEQAAAEHQKEHDLAIGLKAVVESESARGLYQQEATLEEEVAQLQESVARLDARGRAVKLLLGLAEERQRRQSTGLVGPLADRATALWQSVTGVSGRQVVFGDDLSLRGVHVAGAERPVDPFSGGAREQLFLVSRLALGEVLARDGRQFMVIDDSLVNSDPVRRDRLVEVLQDAAQNLQIVILTCDGERYRHLPAAQHLALEMPVEA